MTKLFPAREMKHIQQKLVLNCDKVNLLNDISQNDSSFGMSFTNYSDHFLFLPRLTQTIKILSI